MIKGKCNIFPFYPRFVKHSGCWIRQLAGQTARSLIPLGRGVITRSFMPLNYTYITTEQQFYEALEEINTYISDPIWAIGSIKPVIALDCETYGERLYKKRVPLPICIKEGEPTGLIRLIQIGLNPTYNPKRPCPNRQFVFDLMFLDWKFVADHLRSILESVNVIGHNLKYEYQFMFVQMNIKLKYMMDTMLISKVLLAGDPVDHGLDAAYQRFLDFVWFKNDSGMDFETYINFKKTNQVSDWSGELTEEQIRYAADDVYYIFYVLEQQQEWLRDYINVYESPSKPEERIIKIIDLENKIIPAYAMMELRGAPFDIEHRKKTIALLQDRIDEAASHLGFYITKKVRKYSTWCWLEDQQEHRVGGKNSVSWEEEIKVPMNMRSTQQLVLELNALLQEDLGEDFKLLFYERGVPKNSTREEVIKDAYYKNSDSLSEETKEKLRWVLQYKKASSLMSKAGENYLKFVTDRGYVHPNWFQIGEDEDAVDSGRTSSSNPNLMNVPAREELFIHSKLGKATASELFRASFASIPEWKLVVADFSQIEPVLAAEVCGAKELIKRFVEDRTGGKKFDIHAWTAKIMLGLDYEPAKGSFERDYIGKTAGLSILYGKWWATLKEWMFKKTDGKVCWTDQQAKDAWERFFAGTPEFKIAVSKWDRKVRQKPEENGYSLAFAKKDRGRGKCPIIIAKTIMGRPRRFTLLTQPNHFAISDEALSKDYKDASGKQNVYSERLRAAKTEGFNHTIQGSSADITKLAVKYTHYKLLQEGLDWTEGIVAVIHDEIVLHVKEEHAELAKKILEESMLKAGADVLKYIPAKVGIKIANNWHEGK